MRLRSGRSASFGPRPLINGENSAEYDALLTRVSAAVHPADILEDIWVRDIVDLTWEAWRYRRLKAELMAINAHKALSAVLDPLMGWRGGQALIADWTARKPEAIKRIDAILESAGRTMDSVMAQSLSIKLDDIERIDRMIALAEARRNAALRELDAHQENQSHKLRQTVQQLENGFRAIEHTLPVKDG
jgi:hypothetical protein